MSFELLGSMWKDFRRSRRPLFLFTILFTLGEVWLLVPLVALALAELLAQAGHLAVSNQDIINFLLTPSGMMYAALFPTVAVFALLLQQAGIMAIASGHRLPTAQLMWATLQRAARIVQLAALVTLFLALTVGPILLLSIPIYHTLLSEHDIYFYLKVRPQAFWLAAALGGVLLLTASVLGAWLLVRWAFAVPLVLFENLGAWSALRTSRERVGANRWSVGLFLIGWPLGVLIVGAVAEGVFQVVADMILYHAGERPIVVILVLLLIQGSLLASVTFFLVVGLALGTRRLYLRSSRIEEVELPSEPPKPWNWKLAALSLPLFLLTPLAVWNQVSRTLKERPRLQVTAHRGHVRTAPENTLSAIRGAIDCGADYVEMDVQLTADGVVVLLHDRDLKRVAGDSRRLSELTYAEVRQLDVGSWFDPSFAKERVPRLEEVLQLSRGKIRLNIELKSFGNDVPLAQAVARVVSEQGMEAECLITSLQYEALVAAKRFNPKLRIGLTVAQALGDLNRLEVDAFSVRADYLTDALLRAAHRRDREVHVWTVNDPAEMTRLLKRGVDNLITSDPDTAIRIRDEWDGLTRPERLLLVSRLLLGLEP